MNNLRVVLGYDPSSSQRRLVTAMMALLTGETVRAWQDRELVWDTVAAGLRVKWAVDRYGQGIGWFKSDFSSAAVTEDPNDFWDRCVRAGLIHSEARKPVLISMGDVVRGACALVRRKNDGIAAQSDRTVQSV